MPTPTDHKIELSAQQTRNWLLGGAVAALFTVVNFFFTRQITETAAKIEKTNEVMIQLSATVQVQQVQNDHLRERVGALENAREKAADIHDKLDQRLNSLEQRQALTDQFMEANKSRRF